MEKKHLRFLSLAFFLFGIFFLLNSKTDITGAAVGVSNISSGLSSILGIVFIFISAILFVAGKTLEKLVKEEDVRKEYVREECKGFCPLFDKKKYVKKYVIGDKEHFLGHITGTNPSDENKKSRCNLYDTITENNIEEIFQTPLDRKYGKNIKGAKAIVYIAYDKNDDKNIYVVFLTEATDTHHRHAAAAVAVMKDAEFFVNNPPELTKFLKKAKALYDGDDKKCGDLLTKCAGFELQYDTVKGKIVGIQQDSWLTKHQKALSEDVEESMILALLSNIDEKYLIGGIKNLDVEYLNKLYSGRRRV